MKQAREVALDALTACERQGAWSDGYLKKAIGGAKLDGRDAALATRLCFGVLQNRMLLDFLPFKAVCPPSCTSWRRLSATCCAWEPISFWYLNRVPDHAAVSEAVSLARKKAKNPRAAGLVNGVLRSLIRQREALEPPADLSDPVQPSSVAGGFLRCPAGQRGGGGPAGRRQRRAPHLCPGKHPQNLRRGAGCHADGRRGWQWNPIPGCRTAV